jgi:sulfatase modifying factor 1
MNLTSQYIVNPKSRDTYINSLATYKSIRTTSTRLRLIDDRCDLKPNKNKSIYFKIDNIYFKMIRCPIGEFMMGSDNKDYNRDDNNPKRPIVIDKPFLLGETEVTQELFQAIMGYNSSEFIGKYQSNSNQRPMENISWYDAVKFCNRLSTKLGKLPYYNISNERYELDFDADVNLPNIGSAKVTINPQANGFRLPLEKEWEYAANAGTSNQYAGSNDVNQVAWFKDNSKGETHPVKGKRPNEWGFYDMSGNVREWCYDKYESNSIYRVFRGGSWYDDDSALRSADRFNYLPSNRSYNVGFRVSASLVN